MSKFAVETVKIKEVLKHPNADKLEIVTLEDKDWQCVTAKDNFKAGDIAIYFPVDSLLPSELEAKIFGANGKIKLEKSRVRTIKLRGAISQGLVVKPQIVRFPENHVYNYMEHVGYDWTIELGVKKYEPPVRLSSSSNPAVIGKKQVNPHFRKYTSIENAKNYPSIFSEEEEVSVTEKIHGTNFRAGYAPFHANTVWKRLKKLLGFAPSHEFVYGSHNVQQQNKLIYTGYYQTNVYAEAVVAYALKDKLQPGEVVYGEVYGDGIQKGYTYGCNAGERKLVLFDVIIDGQYLDTVAFRKWASERNLPVVPELYRGPFNKEKILELRDGSSVLAPSQKVREGVVVKPLKEEVTYIGRKLLKYISDDYLLKNQDNETEAH